jgi:hypothetical protein
MAMPTIAPVESLEPEDVAAVTEVEDGDADEVGDEVGEVVDEVVEEATSTGKYSPGLNMVVAFCAYSN